MLVNRLSRIFMHLQNEAMACKKPLIRSNIRERGSLIKRYYTRNKHKN